MEAQAYDEPSADLLAAARDVGFRVTRAQLVRWHLFGVLPRPQQQSLGRSRGSETRYPRGTKEQLLKACALRKERRTFNAIRWGLWWEGYETWRPWQVRDLLPKAAQDYWPPRTEELAELVEGIDRQTLEAALYDTSDDELLAARRELRDLIELLEIPDGGETPAAKGLSVRVSAAARRALYRPLPMLAVLSLWLAPRKFEVAAQWYQKTRSVVHVLLAPLRSGTNLRRLRNIAPP